jgi:hypothetical protein
MLLLYAMSPPLSVLPSSLIVRIGASNEASISLFRKLGFGKSKLVAAFDEVELKFGWNEEKGEMGEGNVAIWKEGFEERFYDYPKSAPY